MLYRKCNSGLFAVYLLSIACFLSAEVVTDGSLGAKVELPGKHFQITPELGQQFGGNLFHSFQTFNLNADEAATFSGATSVQNVIARVTGGSPSHINGLIRSTIPNADLYLINPYGVMFGQNAKLDLQGGFHVSTADYLKLQDGGRFDARNLNNSLLSVAPVAAFGFLSDTPATIQLQDSRLSVPDRYPISLIGGELKLQGDVLKDEQGAPVVNGEITFLKFPTYAYTAELKTPSGRINLASVASRGEVSLLSDDLRITANQLGNITLNHAEVQTSGQGSGNIFIRGANLTLHDGKVSNIVYGQQAGGVIDIHADNILVAGSPTSSSITADTRSTGRGGNIQIATKNLELRGGSITTSAYDRGSGGNITIHVTDLLKLHNPTPEFFKYVHIGSVTYGMQDDAGIGGNIQVEAGQIEIHSVAAISSTSYGRGNTGDLWIKADDIWITGTRIFNGASHNATIGTNSHLGSALFKSLGREGRGGNSGHVTIEAQRLNLSELGVIASNGYTGDSGYIDIYAQDIKLLSGGTISCSTFATGKGGMLSITTQRLDMSENLATREYPTGVYNNSISGEANAGNAGDIRIQADVMNVLDHSVINSSTQNATGGNVLLSATGLLYLQNGKVTTSVNGGIGKGGDISILNTPLIVSNNGKIVAQADAGHGGNIQVVAEHFIPSIDSLVSASSNLGIDGQITISSPTEDVGNQVLHLSANYLNAAGLFPRSCAAKIADQRPSEFIRPFTLTMKPRTTGATPEDLQASQLQSHH